MIPKPAVCVAGVLVASALGLAQIPGQDSRNTSIRHTDSLYSLPDYTRSEWERRAEFLRKQILFSAGLLPMPRKEPLKPRVGQVIEHTDYSVASVLLETHPGFFLGGNLYRPVGSSGPFPAIASPHGHWRYGRFENSELNSVPGRAISLARQGYVVFAYDMVGWNDTMQVPHGFAGPREDLWLVGTLGLQLWNSIRVVDYLVSLDDVDEDRIGVTGASGGGTQAFLLAAVDGRIGYSAPVNMVSFRMQGGSPCENAPLLRVGTNNVELAALFAPKPQLLVSATGDWTAHVPDEEFPAMRNVYGLLDAEANLEWRQFDSPHNYHKDSREAVYSFFGKHILADSDPTHFVERASRPEQLSSLLYLWGRSLPEGALSFEELVRQRIASAESDTLSLRVRGSESLERARDTFRERLKLALLPDLPEPGRVESQRLERGNLLIARAGHGDRIPAVITNADSRKAPATLLVHPDGAAEAMRSGVGRAVIGRGVPALSIDVFQTGSAVAERDISGAGRRSERYYHVFNHSDDANRVQDILTAAAFLRDHAGTSQIRIVGLGRAGLWVLLASALDPAIQSVAADLNQFDPTDDQQYVERLYIPGLRRAGDFRAVAVLLSDRDLLLHNAHDAFPTSWYRDAFEAAGRPGSLNVDENADQSKGIFKWLTQ